MSDRENILNSLGANIREWTIGVNGISADGDEDTNNLMRVLRAHPTLPQAFARGSEADVIQQMMIDRINSYSLPQAATKPAPNLPANPMRMSQAIEQYRAACGNAKLAPKTVFERERLLKLLSDHMSKSAPDAESDPFLHDIGTHHLSGFLDGMSKRSTTRGATTNQAASPVTLIKKVSSLRSFFEWAFEEREATLSDPTEGLDRRDKALRKAASKTRAHYQPFSAVQLESIFNPTQYLAFNNQADYFWAPLLGMHLGTRLKEIITLELDDIGLHEPTGIWFMDVRPEHAKNKNSIRRLPITARLIELGFINYVERMRKLGATSLFPHRDLTSATAIRDPSKNCSRKFGEYLDSINITDPALVFHSFRHTVVSALQNAGTPLKESMEIAGHQAQEHAIRTGAATAEQAQSVHLKVYTHADRNSLDATYPIARMCGYLDKAIKVPLDYLRLSKVAKIVTENTTRTRNGFTSGLSSVALIDADFHIR